MEKLFKAGHKYRIERRYSTVAYVEITPNQDLDSDELEAYALELVGEWDGDLGDHYVKGTDYIDCENEAIVDQNKPT